MSTRHDYMTLASSGTKKISVCGRRIGSRNRMTVLAVCTDETIAERIVDGLNMLQGEITKIDTPAQRTLVEVRDLLSKERAVSSQRAREKREALDKLRILEREYERVCRERDAAQKTAKETA